MEIQKILSGLCHGKSKFLFNMKLLKWILFSIFIISTILCFTVVFLMYYNLSFIDYPYLYLGLIFLTLSILVFKYIGRK